MFNNTIISILGDNPLNSLQKSIAVDLQQYSGESIVVGDYTFEITKRFFVSGTEPLIDMSGYIKIGIKVYKILHIKEFGTYMEAWLYELSRQPEVT